MFAYTRRRLFNCTSTRRLFSSNGDFKTPKTKLFDERTLGLVTLLVTIPTAAYIWKHHKSSKVNEHSALKELKEMVNVKVAPMKKRKVKYLIVGGGAAGFSAIQAIKEADPGAQIVLVGKEPVEPYLRPPLSKELWFSNLNDQSTSVDQFAFSDWHGNAKPVVFETKQFYQTAGVEMILGCEAVDFDLEKRQVGLSDGQVLEFDRLLIATGANPKVLDAPIEEPALPLVKPFRNISEFVELHKALKEKRDMRIVVIGGGFLGSELSVAVSKIGKEMGHSVTQVFPEKGNMALVFPKYLSQWTTEKLTKLGINVKAKRSVRSIESNGQSGVKLILDNGDELEADRVIVAVGVEPALPSSFKSNLKLDRELGGLEADKYLQVAPDVFSAGDLVSYVDPVLGCRRRTEHFDHAVLSGTLAGTNMVKSLKGGTLEPYSNQSMFWSDLGPEVGYEAVGLVDSSLTTVGVWARARPTESPQGTELDATDIRVQAIGQTSISTTEPKNMNENDSGITSASKTGIDTPPVPNEQELSQKLPEITTSPEMSPTYGKGVVFYLKEQKIVGILMFNLFNRVGLAKQILKEGKGVNDVSSCVRLFNVEEVA